GRSWPTRPRRAEACSEVVQESHIPGLQGPECGFPELPGRRPASTVRSTVHRSTGALPACLPRIGGPVREADRMDTATVSVLLIGLILGAVLGAGAVWFLLTSRARLSASEAARATADATAMLRADAAGLRAERAGLVQRLDELTAMHDRTVER